MEYLITPAVYTAFGLAGIISLALYVFKIKSDVINKAVLALAAIIAVLAAAFTYLYSADNEVLAGGFIARRAGLIVFCAACFMVLLSLNKKKHGAYYFVATASVMFVLSFSICGAGLPAQVIGFFTVDLFAVFLRKKEAEAEDSLYEEALSSKLMYLVPVAAFMILFLSGPQDIKLQKLAFNGILLMLLLSTMAGFFTVAGHELPRIKQSYISAGALLSFIPVLAQFVIMSSLISEYHGLLSGSLLTAVVILFILAAAFKSVTEEKYSLFVTRDIYILFFLGILGAVASDLSPFHTALYAVLFVLNIIFAVEAFDGINPERQTMTGLRYSFDKTRNNYGILISFCFGLCAEVFMIISIYGNTANNPFVHALLLIGAAFYSPAFLNKLFALSSMVKRIKVDSGPRTVFNVHVLIMILFSGMAIGLLCKW